MSRLNARVNPEGLIASTLLAFLATAGLFYVNIMSALVDGLVTGLGFSNAEAGTVASANVYGAASGALLAVFLVKRIPWRATACALLLGLIAIDLSSTVLHAAPLLTAVRFLHGLSGGLLVGVSYAVMARLKSPDRAFGMLLVVQYGLGGLGVMWLPKLVPVFGAGVLFLALAAFSTVALAMLAFIPSYPPRDAQAAAAASARVERRPLLLVLAALAAMFLFQAGNMGLGAYVFGLARHAGLGADFASDAVGYATWIGVLGALLCVVLGTRIGRFWPLLVAMVVTLVGTWAFQRSAVGAVYAVANGLTSVAWAFVVPYLFGMCAQMDRNGQLTVLGGFCSKMGLATGPLAAGRLLVHDDYGLLIILTVAVLFICALIALPAARILDRKGGADPRPA
jgi:predicted MFS family arabinose efflux permease